MPHSNLSKPEQADVAGRIAGILYRTNFLASVERDTAIALIQQGVLITAEPGDILARHGEGPDFVMVLLEGSVAIRSGMRTIGRMDRRGDVIGELGVLGPGNTKTEIVAETPVEAFAITTEALGQQEFIAPAANLYQSLSYSLANCLRMLSIEVNGRPDRSPSEVSVDRRTGLAKPERLMQILDALTTAQNGLPFSIVLTGVAEDLDDEQRANLGETLRNNIRHDDLAAQLDASHFAVVLPNCNAFNARKVASDLQGAIQQTLKPRVTPGIAVATHKGDEDAPALLARARLALEKCDGSVVSAD